MTLLEKKSERKKKALMDLVKSGDYSIAFAMMETERLNDEGKLLDNDYEEVMEYLESLLNPGEEDKQEVVEEISEDTEKNTEETLEVEKNETSEITEETTEEVEEQPENTEAEVKE